MAVYNKMEVEKRRIEKETVKPKTSALDSLEDSWLSRLQRILKLGGPLWRKVLWRGVKGMAGQPFAKGIRCVTHGANPPCQQKPGIRMGLSSKIPWRPLLFNDLDPLTYTGDSLGL